MKRLMLCLMMALAANAALAEIVKNYTINDALSATLDDQGVLTIIGSGDMPNFELPDLCPWSDDKVRIKAVVGESATSVGSHAFEGAFLETVSLPLATNIEYMAFALCPLKTVSLPSATTIGERAFGSCRSLASVSLPNATTVGTFVFQHCESLSLVSLPLATFIGENAFDGCCELNSVSLPNASIIDDKAFADCYSLTSVSLSNATTIGTSAFEQCNSLNLVSLPKAATIGPRAFFCCESLTSVSMSNATTIGSSSFESCLKLNSVSLPNASIIDDGAFVDCLALTSVSLPNATTIGYNAFMGCENLALVSLPAATLIQLGAFSLCDALAALHVNPTMKSEIDGRGRGNYGIPDSTTIITELLSEEVVKNAGYVVQEAVVDTNVQLVVSSEVKVRPSVTLKSGDTALGKEAYEGSCIFYGVTPQTQPETPTMPEEPTPADFRVVSKDALVVGSDEIVVKKESIQAAKAMTVQIVDGQIELGVSVLSNADITASTANWAPVKFAPDTKIGLSADGTKLILPIPVTGSSGFMILQSGDAKLQSDELKLSGGTVFTSGD